jgi:hypothetical protein
VYLCILPLCLTLLLSIDVGLARESVEISFHRKRKCFCLFSFPKIEFLSVQIDSQYSQSGDVLTRSVLDLDNGCTTEPVCILVGVQLNGCTSERVCSLHGCVVFPRKDSSVTLTELTSLHWTTSAKNRHVLEYGRGASSVLLSSIFFFRVKSS